MSSFFRDSHEKPSKRPETNSVFKSLLLSRQSNDLGSEIESNKNKNFNRYSRVL